MISDKHLSKTSAKQIRKAALRIKKPKMSDAQRKLVSETGASASGMVARFSTLLSTFGHARAGHMNWAKARIRAAIEAAQSAAQRF